MSVNLDSMSLDELRRFALDLTERPRINAKRLFPNRPKGYVKATKSLENYAWNKITAIILRQRGEIERAKIYEDITDKIYNSLPDYARTW